MAKRTFNLLPRDNKIHAKSLYREYSFPENILTKSFLHLIHCAGIDYILSLCKDMGLSVPDEVMEIYTQKKITNDNGGSNVYDGRVIINPLDIIIECKIQKNHINGNQLENLLQFKETNLAKGLVTLILYVTPDITVPKELEDKEEIDWISWENVLEFSEDYFEKRPQFDYIYQGFLGIYNEIFHSESDIPKEQMVMLVAGNYAYGQAKEENIYNCQYGRKFRDAKYIGFIHDRKIEDLYEIVGGPVDDEKAGRIFQLKSRPELLSHTINVNKTSKTGKPVAFSMGQPRYFFLEDIQSVDNTNDLEKKMMERTNNKITKK